MQHHTSVARGASIACLVLLSFPTAVVAGGLEDESVLYREEGRARERAGDVAAALSNYRKAVALAPRSPDGYACLGRALSRQGDINGAETAFREALALDSTHLETRAAIAQFYDDRGQAVQALQAWRSVGQAAETQQKYGLAVSAYQEVLKAQADDVGAYAGLARMYQRLGDWQNAMTCWVTLGGLYETKGRPAYAVPAYEQAMKLDPQNVSIARRLAALYLQTGQTDRAQLNPLVRKFAFLPVEPPSAATAKQAAGASDVAVMTTRPESVAPMLDAAMTSAQASPGSSWPQRWWAHPSTPPLVPEQNASTNPRTAVALQEFHEDQYALNEFDAATHRWR